MTKRLCATFYQVFRRCYGLKHTHHRSFQVKTSTFFEIYHFKKEQQVETNTRHLLFILLNCCLAFINNDLDESYGVKFEYFT